MPYNTFADGTVLTASFINTNWRDQVVSTVTSGTRPTGTEGQVIYETDTNKFYAYDGSTWAELIDLDAWTTYTPTWTAASANPAIGDGTITGAYIRVGRLVVCRVNVTMGSTTTYGTGQWFFSAPINRAAYSINATPAGHAWFRDVSALTAYSGFVDMGDANSKFTPYTLTASGTYLSQSALDASTPFTWANTDQLSFQVIYEASAA